MQLNVILYFLKKELDKSITANPSSKKYIINSYDNIFKLLNKKFNSNTQIIKADDIYNLAISDNMKIKLIKILTYPVDTDILKLCNLQTIKYDLKNINGIGDKKANELIESGLNDIKQLNQKKWQAKLPKSSVITLKYNPIDEIPYSLIKELEHTLIDFKADVTLVGGFIRQNTKCHDIDIMISSNNDDILSDYLTYIKSKFKEVHMISIGSNKMSGLILYNKNYLKFDAFKCLPINKYATLLTTTGSKTFNIKLRTLAKKNGFILNQYGIYKLGKDNKKLLIPVRSEKDFFTILKIPYIPPNKR